MVDDEVMETAKITAMLWLQEWFVCLVKSKMMRLERFAEETLSLVWTFDTGPGWTMEATGSGSDHGWLL